MLLIKQAELDAYQGNSHLADIRCREGLIVEIGKDLLPQHNETVIDAKGSALIPGLHDHHIHLLALAATHTSIHCGPPAVNNVEELQHALSNAKKNGWIRGIQYHESIAGELDRWQLDTWIKDRPLRIQHRSGILWILNSCAIAQLQLEDENIPGLERNTQGQLTGRLFRLDHWLREKIGAQDIPDLSQVSTQLANFGITGITDTSANNDANTLDFFEKSLTQKKLRQRIVMMGNEHLPVSKHPGIKRGALKILLDEFQLPDWDILQTTIRTAHNQQRPLAFHCVTEAQLVFALSALEEAGPLPGDRIEHASLCSDETMLLLKKSGVAVVTQPGFLHSRGNQYQQEVELSQHSLLYRCKSFLHDDVPLALSSDAPYGPLNPWLNMRSAMKRCNTDGYIFGAPEKLTAEQALLAYLKDPVDLARYRSVSTGAPADLCLLDKSWSNIRNRVDDNPVQCTICDGKIISSIKYS